MSGSESLELGQYVWFRFLNPLEQQVCILLEAAVVRLTLTELLHKLGVRGDIHDTVLLL